MPLLQCAASKGPGAGILENRERVTMLTRPASDTEQDTGLPLVRKELHHTLRPFKQNYRQIFMRSHCQHSWQKNKNKTLIFKMLFNKMTKGREQHQIRFQHLHLFPSTAVVLTTTNIYNSANTAMLSRLMLTMLPIYHAFAACLRIRSRQI